jgi:hypothetical protein
MGRIGLLIGAGCLVLSACDRPLTAPTQTGVCWRMAEAMNAKQDFRPMATDVENLEACAARLEGLRILQNAPVVGAYQGRFIFATPEELTTAAGPTAQHYRIFTPAERREIQDGYKTLIAREGEG